jgi:glycerol-3-phosphate dehydrogenase
MQPKDSTAASEIKVGVVGAGSWGTALANLLASKGYAIDLWVFEKEVKEQIRQSGEIPFFYPTLSCLPIYTLRTIWPKLYPLRM